MDYATYLPPFTGTLKNPLTHRRYPYFLGGEESYYHRFFSNPSRVSCKNLKTYPGKLRFYRFTPEKIDSWKTKNIAFPFGAHQHVQIPHHVDVKFSHVMLPLSTVFLTFFTATSTALFNYPKFPETKNGSKDWEPPGSRPPLRG